MNEVKKRFDERYGATTHLYGTEPNHLVVSLGGILSEGSTVLDLGAGQGRNALYLASLGHRVTTVEPSSVGNGHVQERAAEARVTLERAIEGDFLRGYVWGEIGDFDAVICINALQFLEASAVKRTIRKIKARATTYVATEAFVERDDTKRKLK